MSSANGYILDTNVISETRKLRAHPNVVAFIAGQDANVLFLSALTLGELRKGVAVKRQTDPVSAARLSDWVDGIETHFADRVLPIDLSTARLWGEISVTRSLPVIDALIAATALSRKLTVVTRNTTDFVNTGVRLLDPWSVPDQTIL